MNPFPEDSSEFIFFSQMTNAINKWMLEKYPNFDTSLTGKIKQLEDLVKITEIKNQTVIEKLNEEKKQILQFFKDEINKFLSKEHPGVASRLCNLAGDLEAAAKKLKKHDEEVQNRLKKIISSDSLCEDFYRMRDEIKIMKNEWEALSKKLKNLFK